LVNLIEILFHFYVFNFSRGERGIITSKDNRCNFGEIYKNVDMRGEVALLTRNVLIDAEDAVDSTTYGGHIKVNR
jgi:hypothetical protein